MPMTRSTTKTAAVTDPGTHRLRKGHTMKSLLTAVAAAAALAVPAAVATPAASAYGHPPHSCALGFGGSVLASWATPCPFARNIWSRWDSGRCWRAPACGGETYSPVTNRVYELVCHERSAYPEHVNCAALGTQAWIRFTYSGD